MYTYQTLDVKWGYFFRIMNGKNSAKQGGVSSPLLFAVYTDGVFNKLQYTGVDCHMGWRFCGALAYADDITVLLPSRYGMILCNVRNMPQS